MECLGSGRWKRKGWSRPRKWKWAEEEETYKAEGNVAKLVEAAAWTDEQWELAKSAVAPPAKQEEPVAGSGEVVAEPPPVVADAEPPAASSPEEPVVEVPVQKEVSEAERQIAVHLRLLQERPTESVNQTNSLADEIRRATGKVL